MQIFGVSGGCGSKLFYPLQIIWPQKSASPLWLCFLIWKVEIPPLTWKSIGNQWVRESKVPTTVTSPYVALKSVSPSPLLHVLVSSASIQIFAGDIVGTLYSSKPWMQRIAVNLSNWCRFSYYSSIRNNFLGFWPSRDTVRQHLSSLTVATDLTGWVTRVDCLGEKNSHNVNLLRAENCKFPGSQHDMAAF